MKKITSDAAKEGCLQDDPHSCARDCWVETGFTRWGAPIPQGIGLDGKSVNPAKMKFHPGYHKPFASMQTKVQTQFEEAELNDGSIAAWISERPTGRLLEDGTATNESKVVVAHLQRPETI